MKKLNSIGIFALLLFAATVFVSCEDESSSSPSKISFFGEEFTAKETDGLITLGFQLDNPATKDITVSLSVTGGTATEGVDFEMPETSRTIRAGETNGSFAIELINDVADEEDETIEITISAEGLSTEVAKYTVTATDDDCPFEWLGDLGGTDANLDKAGFTGEADVTITNDGGTLKILGLNRDFISAFWGEEIIDEVAVTFTMDGGGNITIEDQYIFTTLYNGVEYPYHIYGTGVLNTCDGNITIDYELDQEGFKVGAYCHSPGNWMTDDIFKAVLVPNE